MNAATHILTTTAKKRHVEEMEPELFAHEKMREHGITVPRQQTKRAKHYVA